MTHSLAQNPLFSLETLIGVAQDAAKRPGDLYADAGDVKVTDKWGHIALADRPIVEVLDRIENAGAWIIMKHVEVDPRYAEVLNEFAGFVGTITPTDQRHAIRNPEMLILITSPRRVTSFHFDAEVNFLAQVRGTKRVWVCNPDDRDSVTAEEIEKYYMGHQNAGTFKPGVEARASVYDLHPGEAVHIPAHGAHWVQNGNEVSISVSLNFELPPSTYKYPAIANFGLRRLGLKPRQPGASLPADRVKAVAGGVAFGGLQVLRKAKSAIKH
ncbi:MAG: hypothetical protein NVS9B4_26190 [Candidatus Acidiferrum sp.]